MTLSSSSLYRSAKQISRALMSLGSLGLLAITNAQSEKPETEPAASQAENPLLSWVPPPDNYDWVQLKSGEWLKGEIKGMENEVLEFDSEELDDLSFDWEDILQIRSGKPLELLLQQQNAAKSKSGLRSIFHPYKTLASENVQLSGSVQVVAQEVRVVNGETETVIPRSEIMTITPGGNRERDYWSGSASIGLTLRSGNLNQDDYNALLHLTRRTPSTRMTLDYIAYVSSIDNVESANNNRVNSELDFWLSRRIYLILPSFEYYNDPFQNIEYRVTLGAGLGFDIIDKSKFKWDISTGPAWQKAKFVSSQPGEPTESESGTLNFSSHFDWDINKRLELIMDYRGQYTKEELGDTTHHFNGTISVELTKSVDLDVTYVWDRISSPKADEEGVLPEPDDHRLIIGFGMDF